MDELKARELKPAEQVVAYFQYELAQFAMHHRLSEKHWIEEQATYQMADEEQHFHRYRGRDDLSYGVFSHFPEYYRRSALIMLMSLFEDFLNQYCDSLQQDLGIEKSIYDRGGEKSLLNRAKNYVKKHTKNVFPADIPQWCFLKKAQDLRNIVVHKGGHPKEGDIRLIHEMKYVRYEEYARLHLVTEAKFIELLLENLNAFADQLGTATRAMKAKVAAQASSDQSALPP